MIQLVELIGTETCSYCGKLTECLSLTESSACRDCIDSAFQETFGEKDNEDEY